MKKYYFPPQITQIALFSESHLLEGSLRLKDSSYEFNKDNSSADWLGWETRRRTATTFGSIWMNNPTFPNRQNRF